MTVKRNLITLLVLSVFVFVLTGAALADAGGSQTPTLAGDQAPLQMTVNLINGDPAADWDTVSVNASLAELGITANNYDDFLDEFLKLVDPDGDSDWHSLFLSSSWDAQGEWSGQVVFDDGQQYQLDYDWPDGGQVWLGIEVPSYYAVLAQLSYSQASGLSIARILTLAD